MPVLKNDDYTNGEVNALVAPCLGLDPEEVVHVVIFAAMKDGNIAVAGGSLTEIHAMTSAFFNKILQISEGMMQDAAGGEEDSAPGDNLADGT